MNGKPGALVIISGLVLLTSCNKETALVPVPAETSDQLLRKIVMTVQIGSSNSYDDVIEYEYDNRGKLIREGGKKYLRDEMNRIIEIAEINNNTNRGRVLVYYDKDHRQQVAYTICDWSGQVKGTDSTVYIHNENGRLEKTMTYIHQFAGTYVEGADYYQYTLPDSTFLGNYTTFTYDADDNLVTQRNYSVNSTGNTIHATLCSFYKFDGYGKSANPHFTDDEVRKAGNYFYGTINVSKNNFTKTGEYTKAYTYRQDGRPLTCDVYYQGKLSFTLKFEYK